MFRPVISKMNLPQIEESILEWWRSQNIFERSISSRQGGPRFVFYEGPPTANGSPGIHHVLARIFKDIIPRYKAMKGYYTPRIAGWDTHGLPVELEIEKQLGFTNKTEIEEYGIDRFNNRCRESVFTYLKEWEAMTERIAFWVDMEHPYVTMKNDYIETVWWSIKQMWDRGLVYHGYKTAAHCPRCGTSLSSHEVALGYKDDVEDPSVYIKFRLAKSVYEAPGFLEKLRTLYDDRVADFAGRLLELVGDKPVYLLAWTTTPWTLPGNTALAVAADADYAIVEHDGEYLVMAEALLESVGLGEAPVAARIKGSDLVDLRYEPLFNPFDYGVKVTSLARDGETSSNTRWQETGSFNYPVIDTDFVSLEDGTGIVHMAPAFGEVDFEAGMERGLNFVQPVDLQGNITNDYPFSGKFVKEADPLVLEALREKGLLYRSETIRHTYPFCWRCETPLLYYVKRSWYIRTTEVKKSLLDGNARINWYPEHIKDGRFGDWLENNVDWAFSRERYWGTPLPVWRCAACDAAECVGGIEDLKNRPGFSGWQEPPDLHRPYVDEMTLDCTQCGGKMKRVSEVIDCWFDSGAMPVAQHHYPFENETLLEDGRFPADYICEAIDQTRGWFYSLHAISTLLFDRPCFQNVICLGHILDAKGEKMSKAKGNVIEPWQVINKYGADPLRWYLFTSTSAGNVRRFAEEMVAEVTRRFLLTLWNVYSFFINYANIDNFVPGGESVESHSELDRWVLSELNQLIVDVDEALDNYNPTEGGRKIESFVSDLSNWYVRRSRRRFWKSESDADKLAAYNTLYHCLVTLAKLMAPFTPFLAEELYRNLVGTAFPEAPESVHLADFPVADRDKIDKHVMAEVQVIKELSSLGRAARSKVGIKVRQPIAMMMVDVKSEKLRKAVKRFASQIKEEVNVKEIEMFDDITRLSAPRYAFSSAGNLSVAIDTEITPELAAEGTAREIVRRLQTMRRAAGFNITDHIITCYEGDDYPKQVMIDFTDYIKQETLTERIIEGASEEGAFAESFQLGGGNLSLAVKKLT